jgi:hypothetical protein
MIVHLSEALDPEAMRSIRAASSLIEALYAELMQMHPALATSMAIPGMFIGHAIGIFIVNGMSNDEIVAQVLSIVGQLRLTLAAKPASA